MSDIRSESATNKIRVGIPGLWEDAIDLWDENGMLLAKVLKRGDAKSRHAMLNAAPDMLMALKDCLRLASWDDQRRLNISRVNNREGTVEAIQIARKTAVELRGRIEKSIRKARVAIAKAEGSK